MCLLLLYIPDKAKDETLITSNVWKNRVWQLYPISDVKAIISKTVLIKLVPCSIIKQYEGIKYR